MILNESQKHYAQLIQEELHVTDKNKLAWMSQYAQIHASHEGKLFEGLDAGNAGAGIYATPLNTMGAGNPLLPQGVSGHEADPVNGQYFHDPAYVKGSGDVPMSTLSTALEIAAVTIGFDLVPVVPSTGPMAILTFNDYPYAGGKMGVQPLETALDGIGSGEENKPIYIKFACQNLEKVTKIVNGDTTLQSTGLEEKSQYTLTATDSANNAWAFTGLFMGTSRIDGGMIFQVKSVQKTPQGGSAADESLAAWAAGVSGVAVTIKGSGLPVAGIVINDITGSSPAAFYPVIPELVKGVTDHIQSFSNFFGNGDRTNNIPSDDPMSRAENETGTGNVIGARMFSKVIRMGSYEAVGTVTRQQLQDMPLYGIDVLGGVIETCQNEISQALNNRILDRLFKLGVENYKVQRAFQGADLNLYMGTSTTFKLSDFTGGVPYKKFVDLAGNKPADVVISSAIVNTNAENVITHQRRIMSRILAASNLISSVTRRGRAQWAVTNAQVLTALQDCSQFVVAPMVNDLVQGGEESLYFAGTLAGVKIYVDPYMRWNDTRICVGRKATVNNNRVQGSGVVFMPYILADQVQIIAEGTMAPKVLINSRFAIVDAGWYPEQNYYTFMVDFGSESTFI